MFKETIGQEYTVDILLPIPLWDSDDENKDTYLDIDVFRLWAFKQHVNSRGWKWSIEIKGRDYTLIEGDAESQKAAKIAATQIFRIIKRSLYVLEQFNLEHK